MNNLSKISLSILSIFVLLTISTPSVQANELPQTKIKTVTEKKISITADPNSELIFQTVTVSSVPAPVIKKLPVKIEQSSDDMKIIKQKVNQRPVESPKIVESNTSPVSSSKGQLIVAAALAQLGATQDCTALVERALRAAGVAGVGDESPASLLKFGFPVSDPQPGDMAYYSNGGSGFAHIAIYIGNGQAVHGGWLGNQTVINSVNVGSGPVFYRVA